jgi:tetratricopeptide (TPR) repeat protein
LDAALADCKAAIKRDGPQASYLDSLGLVQLRLKNYPAAIDAYGQAVAIRPRAASSQYGLGLANIRGDHVDVGNADLAAAKALDPKIDEWFSQFGI